MPPASAASGPWDQALGPGFGVCVIGQTDSMGNVTTFVRNAGVTGLTVTGFAGSGIVAYGAQDASFTNNSTTNDGGYGTATFSSSGMWIASTTASGNEEAGIYIGDSPDARATLERNTAWRSRAVQRRPDAAHGQHRHRQLPGPERAGHLLGRHG
jgi:hypothetical protein